MLTNSKLIVKFSEENTKNKVLDAIANKMVEEGYVKSKKPLLDAFKKREEEFSTGLGDGIAIPHAEVEDLEQATVLVARVKGVDWDSLDGKPVETAVAIMVPKGGRGEHLSILAELSKKMVNSDFLEVIKNGKKAEVVELINSVSATKEEKPKKVSNNSGKYVIGITACPTGIAHTFMAQQKIIDACESFGYEYKVETQGSEGIKDKLSVEDIKRADAIIISTGKELEEMERFNGFEGKIFTSELQNTIKNNKEVVESALKHAEGFVPSQSTGSSNMQFTSGKKSKFEIGMGHMMSGISAFIPLIITAGLLMAIGNIGALYWVMTDTAHTSISSSNWINGTLDSNAWVELMWWINQTGSIVMKFMFPFFTMYLAMSIGGRIVMIPAFIGGVMAAGLETSFFTGAFFDQASIISWAYPNGFISSSFFGAIIIGFFIGTFGKYLNNKIQVSPNMLTFKTLLAIPLILTLSTFLLMGFIINPVFGMVNYGISEGFKAAGESGKYIYNLSIAAGMAFDLGGPVNKAALSVAYGFLPEAEAAIATINEHISAGDTAWLASQDYTDCVNIIKTFNVTGKNVGQVIPPIGLGMAAVFGNKVTGRHLFDNDDQQLGGQSMFLGTIGISEGAIPFLLKYPLYVLIADMVGAMFGVTVALMFGTIQTLAIPAIWGWFLAGSTTIGISGIAPYGVQIFGYFAGVITGAIVTASIIIAFLLLADVKQDAKNKVYSKNEKAKLSGDELTLAEVTTKNSINNMIDYLKEEMTMLHGAKPSEFKKLTDEEINNISMSFSREKVKLANEKSKLAKLTFLVQKDKNKIRQYKSQINELTENAEYKKSSSKEGSAKIAEIDSKLKIKIEKINTFINDLNIRLKNNEDELAKENAKIATYIAKQLDTIERIN